MKTFVWHQGALGDLILSLPSLHAIRRNSGNSTLHLFSRTDLSEIILRNNLADEVLPNEKAFFADLFRADKNLPGELGRFLSGFGAAFVFMRNPDTCFLENIGSHIPCCCFIKTVPPDDLRVHVSDFQLGQLEVAGIKTNAAMPVLDAPAGRFSVFPQKNIIALHPGSGGQKKCWPLDNYLKLVSLLHSGSQYYFYFILGPAEGDETLRETNEFIIRNRIDGQIIKGKSLTSVAGAIKMSSLYVGNDSGMTHLASALGIPVVAIFGPTDHERWRPLGNASIMHSQLVCSPCKEDDYRKCVDVRCLGGVRAEGVASAVNGLLNVTRRQAPCGG